MFTLIQTNARGVRMGTSSPTHRYTDAQVEHACEMRAAGTTVKAVADLIGCNPSAAWRWAAGHRRRAPEAVRAVRPKGAELPRHGRGPAHFTWVNTPIPLGGLPRGLHDHCFPSTKCPPDVWHIECQRAFVRASPYEVDLLNQATNSVTGLQFNLIPK